MMEFYKGPQGSALVKAVPFKVLSRDSYGCAVRYMQKEGGKNDKKRRKKKTRKI